MSAASASTDPANSNAAAFMLVQLNVPVNVSSTPGCVMENLPALLNTAPECR